MTIRIGLVGFGPNARRHLSAFRRAGATIVSVAARSRESQDAARDAGVVNTFSSTADLIAHGEADALVVTPAIDANFETASVAIAGKRPVLVEKPPGTSLAETRRLELLATTHGAPVMVAFNRIHYASLRAGLRAIGGRDAVASVHVEWSEDPKHLARRGFTAEQIHRRACTNSLHGLSLMTHLLGQTQDVVVQGHEASFGERTMAAFITARGGRVGTFVSSWRSPLPWRATVVGSNGDRFRMEPLETCVYVSATGDRTGLDLGDDDQVEKPGFVAQARAFLRVVEGAAVPEGCTLQDAAQAMSIGERLTKLFRAPSTRDDGVRS